MNRTLQTITLLGALGLSAVGCGPREKPNRAAYLGAGEVSVNAPDTILVLTDYCNGAQERWNQTVEVMPSDGRVDSIWSRPYGGGGERTLIAFDPDCPTAGDDYDRKRAQPMTPELREAANKALNANRELNFEWMQSRYEQDQTRRAQK